MHILFVSELPLKVLTVDQVHKRNHMDVLLKGCMRRVHKYVPIDTFLRRVFSVSQSQLWLLLTVHP